MWAEFLRGLVLYEILRRRILCMTLRRIFDGDAFPDVDTSNSDACFAVASRLEKRYGGKAFVGLRIPDAEAGTRQHIDVVLLTNREVMVVAVRNFSGDVTVGKDGNWMCSQKLSWTIFKNHKPQIHPDPVLEVSRQVTVLESYLEQRGVPLPKGHVIGRIILPHPNCRPSCSISFQPEVLSFDKWRNFKPEWTSGLLNWIKGAFDKSGMQDLQKLHVALSTSPMWDRLQLKGDKIILGEFHEFEGNQDDMQALRNVKRSKVGRFIVQNPSLVLDGSRLELLYSPRDYRSEGASSSEWKEAVVKPSTEVLFHPLNSKKVKKFKLSSIVSVILSG